MLGASAVSLRAAAGKPLRGAFIILNTPYTDAKAVDYEDLAREVDFLARCGAHGMVWPQMASEYPHLSREERLRGMEVLAKAAKGKQAALVLGIQADNTKAALEFARRAEELGPDAVIAMPPKEAKTLDDYREYFAALARVVNRPFFIQTTGGAKAVVPSVEFLIGLSREFPHFGYIKEEQEPSLKRIVQLSQNRPPIKAVFSGSAGRNMLFEMRVGSDGTMPGPAFADIYAQIWDLYQAGKQAQARDLFARLLLMITVSQQNRGAIQYIMKKRGVFKNVISRGKDLRFTPQEIAEIDFNFEALKPYLRA